jgi:two-component sensor histidine kinase/ligand-binding sensor domain-containing protein
MNGSFFKFLAALTVLYSALNGQPAHLRFQHLNIENGLSNSKVNAVFQDSRGFMWFGTNDGLNKYDGYAFTVYKHDADDSTSLSHNLIRDICEDRSGRLWIATEAGGLSVYDRERDRFTCRQFDPDDSTTLASDYVNSIARDGDGRLWIGTRDGLCRYEETRNRFVRFRHDASDQKSLQDNLINKVYVDSRNRVWISSQTGWLDLYDGRSNAFRHIPLITPLRGDMRVFSILEDRQGTLWIGTAESGLLRFDEKKQALVHDASIPGECIPSIRALLDDAQGNLWIGNRDGLVILDRKTKAWVRYAHESHNSYSLLHSSVQSLFRDAKGDFWIGTRGGIDYVDINRIPIRHVPAMAGDSRYLNGEVVFAIFEDSRDNLWIGTEWGGVNLLRKGADRFTTLMHKPGDPNSLGSDNVKCVLEDHAGIIWIGTYEGGLNRYDPEQKRFTHYLSNPKDPNTLSSNDVYWIMEDRAGDLWIDTHNGISVYQRALGTFIRYNHDPADRNSLSHSDCKFIYEDRQGEVWVGTFSGLNRYNRNSGTFTRYVRDRRHPDTLSDNYIQCMYEDAKGRFWVGTLGGGLNLFDRKTGTSTAFMEKDGLPNNAVCGILEDGHGNLWLSTNKGLSRFNPETRSFRNFDALDGLQGDQFNYNAFFKSRSGLMTFGGMNGLNAFYPDSLKENAYIPPVVITGFEILSKPVAIGTEGSPLQKHISETDEIRLSHRQNVITFTFSALNYAGTPKNRYAYKMEGFDKDWNEAGTKRTATYMNLRPNTYVFRVKASNNHGRWNETGARVRVIIRPPFWRTIWFELAAAGGLVLFVYELIRVRTRNIIRRNKNLEAVNLKLSRQMRRRRNAEKRIQSQLREKEILLREVHHRVKNNLQVISSLLRLEQKNVRNGQSRVVFQKFQDRVKSIALVHEKLYQSKNFTSIDFNGYIHSLANELFRVYGSNPRRIALKVEMEKVQISVDKAVPCGLVINELISNALKYAFPLSSRRRGEIVVSLRLRHGMAAFTVRDNGTGIPATLDVRQTESLGLRLVRILVEDQLNGQLKVERNRGTAFHFSFKV